MLVHTLHTQLFNFNRLRLFRILLSRLLQRSAGERLAGGQPSRFLPVDAEVLVMHVKNAFRCEGLASFVWDAL